MSEQGAVKSGAEDPNRNPLVKKVPSGVILVKGAWSSASDSLTSVPEQGNVVNGVFRDDYFGMTYTLPADWIEKYEGPPPSDTGLYVLAQFRPADTLKDYVRGSILITAQDMFFTPLPASNVAELVNYTRAHLQAGYEMEVQPTATAIANRSSIFFAYFSPVAQLHWYVLATEIRCHTVQIMLTSRDTKLLDALMLEIKKMKLPETDSASGGGAGAFPACIKDYAQAENIVEQVEPIFTEHRFNPVPVRIVINKEGKVKHIHVLSAFPDQAKAIKDALGKWEFKPCRRNGRLVEVETGILFGHSLSESRNSFLPGR